MADLLVEIESFVDYFTGLFPTATIERQNVPVNPAPNTFVIKMTNTEPNVNQEYTFVERIYSMVYIGVDDMDCFAKVETIRKDLQNRKKVIPLKSSSQVIRIQDVSYSEPFEYDDGSKGIILVVSTQTQEINEKPVETLITDINTNL